jgi:hypothetical protein
MGLIRPGIAAITLFSTIDVINAQPPMRSISSAPSCSTCTVVASLVTTLRLPSDSLSFGIRSRIAGFANGTFVAWELNETPVPALFDRRGQFLRLISSKGEGPGEVLEVGRVIATHSDTVVVLDASRRHLFSSDLTFIRTVPSQRRVDDLVYNDRGVEVVAARIGSPQAAGLPLHLLDRDGSIARSFGTLDPVLDPRRMEQNGDDITTFQYRELTRGAGNTFWTWNNTRFLLEQYEFNGTLLARGRHALDGWYADATAVTPGRGEFKGLRLLSVQASAQPEVLWLIYLVRNSSFREPTSRPTLGSWAPMHDMVVEALDTQNFRVLARYVVPRTVGAKVAGIPDAVAVVKVVDDLFHDWSILKLQLVRNPLGPEGG